VIFPITATSSPTSAAGGHPPEQVDAMRAPWFKAVTVDATVWAQPYAPERFGAVTAANAAALVAAGLLSVVMFPLLAVTLLRDDAST
jgi:hypothetical protein